MPALDSGWVSLLFKGSVPELNSCMGWLINKACCSVRTGPARTPANRQIPAVAGSENEILSPRCVLLTRCLSISAGGMLVAYGEGEQRFHLEAEVSSSLSLKVLLSLRKAEFLSKHNPASSQGRIVPYSTCCLPRKCGPVVRILAWDLGDLHAIPCSATDSLCDLGQVI